MTDKLSKFLRERRAALVRMDLEWAKKMLPDASSDAMREMAMHKARYEAMDISAELRQASREWLEVHGFKRLGGMPWPDESER
mgnify:CR=1 FL=1|jgi:uncharacterized membrane protein